MKPTKNELILEEMIPQLEAEHDLETCLVTRAIIWQLIDSAEQYLLDRENLRKLRTVSGDEGSPLPSP